MTDARRYSDDEVHAIIERALAEAPAKTGLTHAELLAVGEQVGISAETMTEAAHRTREARLDAAATRAIGSKRRRWLAAHAGLAALVNGLLFAVNFLTTPGQWWALFPIFFWGLALALHAGAALAMPVSNRALQRERRRLESDRVVPPRLRVDSPEQATAERNAAERNAAEPSTTHELAATARRAERQP